MPLSLWYFAIKGVAYATWMYVGLRAFAWPPQRRLPLAVGLGVLRLLMGLGFGVVIWLGGSLVYERVQGAAEDLPELIPNIATYLAVYVPVRWIEWGIFELVLNPDSRTGRGFFLGTGSRGRKWRLGGIAMSCIADIPVILSLGGVIPVGRFMC